MPSPARILGIAVAAALLAGGGFAVGRLTAPEPSSTAADCAEPRRLHQEYIDSISPDVDQPMEEKRTNGRMLANTILQNPGCFSVADRASAQTILDTIDQGVQEDAINDLRSDVEECVEDATDAYSWSNC
ncbi:hypothetical protein [Streptomyces sp. KR55]|uniref:hypothetical protein n=1 Tax=Streptomyces sp. KR55 TaxID=3457425 RepID=UPI003FD4EFF2